MLVLKLTPHDGVTITNSNGEVTRIDVLADEHGGFQLGFTAGPEVAILRDRALAKRQTTRSRFVARRGGSADAR